MIVRAKILSIMEQQFISRNSISQEPCLVTLCNNNGNFYCYKNKICCSIIMYIGQEYQSEWLAVISIG